MEDLARRLEATEMEAQRLSDALEQMSAQKAALERDVASMQNENERLQVDNEALAAEKWELSAANADLQNRLQAVSYMQVSTTSTYGVNCTYSVRQMFSTCFRNIRLEAKRRRKMF